MRMRLSEFCAPDATLITELAESGASDQTIMDIAGHVSRQMLKHYSHIRMKAKREALEAVWKKQEESGDGDNAEQTEASLHCSPDRANAQEVEGESLQSPYNRVFLREERIGRRLVNH